ncbi:beta-glucosidase [Loktanella fryxellensis]|uniref:Beta-glucosidase n=1 Tax=Loktanella fryxellensis TaxID=245187 RepID=A0A1H8C8W4_9RHOB|nr:glycoside hydrolase family 3 C-terminal domain-containing protein [Loktanella fryxellensis]SEM91651.1 beta-glucosidase [Loktanella fryxellensis]
MTDRLATLVDALTLEEQVSLLSGADFWSLPAIARLDIGKLRVTDGPNGARGSGSLIGGVTAAAFPVGIAIGATWDPDLAQEIGAAIAQEVKSKGAHVSLAPTVNIQRSVTNGRNFECYSEDPELTAALAVGYINGLQSQGVAATVKHFAGNESEIQRTTISSDVDERTLREVYLRPFEAAVKDAGTWAVMSSYNRLNGTYTAENRWLLTDVLRRDWGFDGVVMSDWFGSRSTAPTINAGLDLEMPGPTRDRGAALVAAVEAGEVTRDTVRTRALAILRLMDRTGALDDTTPFAERADDRPEHRALIRRAGAAGMVMLRNDGILPLADPARIAVIGPNAKVARIMGGGSAQLNPHYSITPWDALAARMGDNALNFAQGCDNHRWQPLIGQPVTVDYFANETLDGAPVHTEVQDGTTAFLMEHVGGGHCDPRHFSLRATTQFTPDSDGTWRFGLHVAGLARLTVDGQPLLNAWEDWTPGRTFFEEGNDEVTADIALTAGQPVEVVMEFRTRASDNLHISGWRFGAARLLGADDIAQAVAAAAQADVALVFVGRSGEWDTEGWDLEDIALPGAQDALVAAVTAANPRTIVVLQTGGPVEMPWLDATAAVLQAWYPGQEAGNAIADVLFGDAEPGGRLAQTFPRVMADNPTGRADPAAYPGVNGHVRYDEGVFTGHRHYDRAGTQPLFPLGWGLSYTTFALSDMRVTPDASGAQVSITVTNTGDRAGSTVPLVFVGDGNAPVERPLRELKGFAKVHLAAGERREVAFNLPPRAFAWFDAGQGAWCVTGGRYTVEAGFDAGSLPLTAMVDIAAQTLPR